MAKKRVRKNPTGGGLSPVNEKGLAYKRGLTVDLILTSYFVRPKVHDNDYSDKIVVTYLKRLLDDDGDIVREKEMAYTIDDVGAYVEYDLFDETLFNQADIDNPAYIVVGDPVTRIYWVDGQIDDGDGNMIDNEIDIEPYQRKGTIDYSSEVVITAEKTPLKGFNTAYGNDIGLQAINNIKNRNGY